MNRFAFVFLAISTMILSGTLSGCGDRDAENEPVSPSTTQPAGTAMNPAHTGSGDGQMDHEDMEQPHEEEEGMAHEHGEHADMQGASHWNAPAEAATFVNPVTADSASVKRGRAIYAMNCIACHGATGKGDGPIAATLDPRPADLSAMAPMHPGGDFFWKIENGRGAMPAWKDTLDENQTWDLVNYIKSLGETEPSEADGVESDGHNHSH